MLIEGLILVFAAGALLWWFRVPAGVEVPASFARDLLIPTAILVLFVFGSLLVLRHLGIL